MKTRYRITSTAVAAVLAGSMVCAGGQAATAAPAHTGSIQPAASSVATITTPASSSLISSGAAAGTLARSAAAPSAGDAGPTAVPIAVRLAVQAGLRILKATSKSWYNNVMSYVSKGKTVFVNWWNNSVPGWIKNMFGGVSAAAIYDAIRWIIGI